MAVPNGQSPLNELIHAAVVDFGIPELMAWLRSRGDGQPLPTDDEAKAHMHANAGAQVAKIDDYLTEKGVDPNSTV